MHWPARDFWPRDPPILLMEDNDLIQVRRQGFLQGIAGSVVETITSCGALVWESTEATAEPTVWAAW